MKTFGKFLEEHGLLDEFRQEIKSQLESMGLKEFGDEGFLDFRYNGFLHMKDYNAVKMAFDWNYTERGWDFWEDLNIEWNESLVLHEMIDLN